MAQPVRGVETLNRAFTQASSRMLKDLPRVLAATATPIELTAEALGTSIGAGREWSQMRKGAGRTLVYVAPQQRGTRVPSRKRPKFALRLLRRAMVPALDANREQVGRSIDELVARIASQFNRG